MEDAANVHRCCFRWDIYDPFKTWQRLQTTFHHGSPTVTQWKATLQPMDRGPSYWNFTFGLEFDEWFKHRYDIPAEAVLVVIELNGKIIRRKKVSPCFFCKANWYTYSVPSNALMGPYAKPHHLAIKIEISLPERDVGNGLFFHEDDLKGLSSDLKKLLNDQEDFNMLIKSKRHNEPVKVLSYMIDTRWDNFFTMHKNRTTTGDNQSKPSQVKPTQKDAKPEDGTPKLFEVDISRAILWDILNYIYSGVLSISWPDWRNSDKRNAEYIAELFHVIDAYKMYDLHKAFVNHLQRERVTRNLTLIESCLFQLNIVNGRPIENSFRAWNVNRDPEYDLIFKIRVSKDEQDLPWLSYSLQSKIPNRVHVEVNLEVVKKVKGNDGHKVENGNLLFHGQGYSLNRNSTVNSNHVLFLGCPEIWGDTLPEGPEIQYFIQCSLNVTNGETADQFRGVHIDTSQSDLERLSVLSNDMYKLKMRKESTDYELQSRVIPGENVYLYSLHHGILKARVPELGKVIHTEIQNLAEKHEYPPFHTMLSHKTISFVLDYIYTGKVFPVTQDLFNEVGYFAEHGEWPSLHGLVERIRLLDE